MKTDERGGASAREPLEERLARDFEAELARAEDDYPTLPVATRLIGTTGPVVRSRGSLRWWPRLAAVPIGLVAIVLAVAVASPLLSPRPAPIVPGSAPSGPAMGADGIPLEIDGQHVYRIGDDVWGGLSGSFLLGGYVQRRPLSCPSVENPGSKPLSDLVASCPWFHLAPSASANAQLLLLAPIGSDQLTPWSNGFPVVVRVHTHDGEAAQCPADQRSSCEAAVVIEAVVWPLVPAQIGGEKVYRAADQASFPTSGSFLLGGPVTMPDVIPPCPMPIDHTTAENDLIPYCYWQAIDGIHVAPKVDALANVHGRVVVAQVHINDPEASGCPAEVLAQCKAAVVVEEVVWTGGPAPSPSPGLSPYPTTPLLTLPVNPASSMEVGPNGSSLASPMPSFVAPPPPPAPSAS